MKTMSKMRILIALVLASMLILAGCRVLYPEPEEFFTQAITKIKGGMMIDNPMDQIAMTIQGHSTQTSSLLVLEQSDGTDVFTVSNAGVLTAEGTSFGGTAGATIAIGTDDTTADDIDIGSAKDDLDLEGEDITLDTADDANATVADDLTFTMESAGGIVSVNGTLGWVLNLATDNSVADDLNIGSAKDDVLISGEDITFDTADDADVLVADDFTFTMESAANVWSVTGTPGFVVNICTDDTTADDVNIGSAKDDVDLAGATIDLTLGAAVTGFAAPAAAGSGGDILDVTATFGAMNGSDTSLGIDLNLTGANATGTTNLLYGIDIDLTTPDPQVTEKAIDLNDADWDYAIDTGHVPIVSTAATFMDDFFGGTVAIWWTSVSGTDAQAVQAIQANAQYGEYQLTSGDDNAGGCAASCEGIVLGTHYSADQGSLIFETRVHIDTAVANEVICVGLTDNAALEMPVTIGALDARTWVADDAVVVCYNDAAATDQWWFLSRDDGAGGEGTGTAATGVAPTADVYQVIRIEIDAGGEDARAYINGTLVGTITANCVTVADLLTPFVMVDTNANESNVIDVDYVFVSAQRQ
jgi:hypothetical protein